MLPESVRCDIINLIKQEVVPAMGCTEPMAVALATARAKELLGENIIPEKIDIYLSSNILKNALGVGIPGTGMIGLPIAVALGAIIGRSRYELEVLRDVTAESVEDAKKYIAAKKINISLKEGRVPKLYIEAIAKSVDGNTATAIISRDHNRFVFLKKNDDVILDNMSEYEDCDNNGGSDEVELNLKTVWEFATESPINELRFILQSRQLNKAIAERSLAGEYGHSVGKILRKDGSLLGDCIYTRILSYTTAACDARMAGAPLAVMSNSGSGNQGIAATLPVVVYAEEKFASEEETVRALILSHLTAIYIKQSLGKLSALCGCVVAATGSACGICYLMGGTFDHISATAKNMVANLTGMICDGAKPSCAMKLASGVSTAMLSAMMAMEGQCVTSSEGIVDDDVDKTIHNLTSIGRDGMADTDRLILKIMTE